MPPHHWFLAIKFGYLARSASIEGVGPPIARVSFLESNAWQLAYMHPLVPQQKHPSQPPTMESERVGGMPEGY